MSNQERKGGRVAAVVSIGVVLAAPVSAHVFIAATTRMSPPHVDVPTSSGRSWTRVRTQLREVYLGGAPEAMGAAHARLLREQMIRDEERLWADYEHYVPWWI